MLPRVSAALAHFIQPLVSNSAVKAIAAGKDTQTHPEQGHPHPQDPKQKPQLRMVPNPDDAQSQKALKPVSTPLTSQSVTHSFLHILQLLKAGQAGLLRWIGNTAYQMSLKKQKKSTKARKGILVDERIE